MKNRDWKLTLRLRQQIFSEPVAGEMPRALPLKITEAKAVTTTVSSRADKNTRS